MIYDCEVNFDIEVIVDCEVILFSKYVVRQVVVDGIVIVKYEVSFNRKRFLKIMLVLIVRWAMMG